MKVKFTVLGTPVGKGHPRFSRQGQFVRTYTPDKTVNYETLVRMEYEQQCGGFRFEKEAPLDMRITAYLPIPKSVSKRKRQAMLDRQIRPLKKSDSSNIMKAIEDALNGVAYHDDVQIVDSQVRRFYGEPARVVVTIQEAGTF